MRIFSVVFASFLASSASAGSGEAALQSDLDHVWTMTAAALVLFMQGGFLLLEAGQVRAKNAVNVAMKNLVDFTVSAVAFGLIGFSLMFGASAGGWIGWEPTFLAFGAAEPWTLTFFVFQLMFCGTAATIMSGAVAERMTLGGYVVTAVLLASVIYPVAGHWAWGGLLNGSDEPFLARLGFMDFAGSTVVHSVGAWVGLAAAIVIGPRLGKFDEDGHPVQLHGHSPILSTFGVIVLWVGWIGFNGGSTTSGTEAFAVIVANTMIAGAVGGCMSAGIGRWHRGYNRPEFVVNGILSGLVGITAGCDAVSPQAAALMGALASVASYVAREVFEGVCKIDDPLGAVAVHGVAGATGTVLTAAFAHPDMLLAGSRGAQIVVQLTGVGLVFVWAFGLSFAVLWGLHRLLPNPDGPGRGLRVPQSDEEVGLNISEHKAPLGVYGLTKSMAAIAENPDAKLPRLEIDPGDEAAEAGTLFNRILDGIEARRAAERANSASKEDIDQFNERLLEVLAAYARGDFCQEVALSDTPDSLVEITTALNEMAGTVNSMLSSIEGAFQAFANGDLNATVPETYVGVAGRVASSANSSISGVRTVMEEIDAVVRRAAEGDFSHAVSEADRAGFLLELSRNVNAIGAVARSGLDDIGQSLQALSAGDLSARMRGNHMGAFAAIAKEVDSLVEAIERVVLKMHNSINEVRAASEQISAINADLSCAASENLNAITALNVEMDALRSTVRENDTRATETLQATDEAKTRVDRALKTSSAANDALLSANVAMQSIISTTEAIEDVAAQTRLLSLNASVEAARAPANVGKGFAVVASEVRALAETSNANAENIKAELDAVQNTVDSSATSVCGANDELQGVHSVVENAAASVRSIAKSGSDATARIGAVDACMSAVAKSANTAAERIQVSTTTAETLAQGADAAEAVLAYFSLSQETDRAA